MLKDAVEAEAVGEHRLRLTFEDGVEGDGEVDALVPFRRVFAPLRDPAVFAAVQVDHELGGVCRPTGADLDPELLCALATGRSIPDLEAAAVRRLDRALSIVPGLGRARS